jgi:CRP/FNR family transcriptional regulator, dissimilatory nitrate respiration regulator
MDLPAVNPSALGLLPERAMRTRAGGAAGLHLGMAGGTDARMWQTLMGSPAPSTAECEWLNSVVQVRTVPQGASVFSRMEGARTMVAVAEGDVALGFRTVDGTFRSERIVRGPAWLDLSSAWLSASHAMDAQAWSVATLVELPRDALQAQIERQPALAKRVIQGLAREVQALAVNTHELMHKDAPARLAQWLLQRCERLADAHQAVVQLPMRKRDIASQLAITPETLSRLMRSFTRQGVIEVAGYTVRVLDVPALAREAEA